VTRLTAELQEENVKAEITAAAREKKAAKKARRKERDAAVKVGEEPLPAAAIVEDPAAAGSDTPAASLQPAASAVHPQEAASSWTTAEVPQVHAEHTGRDAK